MPRVRDTIEAGHTSATFPDSSTSPHDMKYGLMTKEQLHATCKERGLLVHGNKTLLIQRLRDADNATL